MFANSAIVVFGALQVNVSAEKIRCIFDDDSKIIFVNSS